jgi:peroxiredoxin
MTLLINKIAMKLLPIIIFMVFFLPLNLYAAEIEKIKAPDFTLKSYAGNNLKLSEFRGQVVLLNFWASWCGPCRQEMPLLNTMYKKYKKLGFVIIGVNVEEDSRKARQIVKKMAINFPILFDTQNTVSGLYDVSAMPSSLVIDRSGYMRYLHKGYKPGDMVVYEKWVKALLRE